MNLLQKCIRQKKNGLNKNKNNNNKIPDWYKYEVRVQSFTLKSAVVAYTFNPRTPEVEAGGCL